MPPSTVADMMIYWRGRWTAGARRRGRTALSAPGKRVRKLTDLPDDVLDPRGGLGANLWSRCQFVRQVSVFDNGMDIRRVDWVRDGTAAR